ncbi:MAG TPA: hypothetical protein VMT88_14235 [Actinomycetes bacterium]|nr:hypothetical protein [Actinomycetes bacterium]
MSDNQPSGMAVGFTAFAGVMMIVVGFFHAIAGFGAILEDKVYVVGQDYVFSFDATTWGWIHLLIGVILAIAGFGVFTGSVAARAVGVLLAGISAIVNFAFLLGWNAPFWSIIIIAIDVTIIWALTMHGRDIAEV